MKIILGKLYGCKDDEGNVLPTNVTPIRKEGKFYVCVNDADWRVRVKATNLSRKLWIRVTRRSR